MLSVLTRFLYTHKYLHIPSVGSFEVVQLPASLDIASKLIHPPSWQVLFKEGGGELREHQLLGLAAELQTEPQEVQKRLQQWGRDLKTHLRQAPFAWPGVGTLEGVDSQLQLQQALIPSHLQPVEAHKVMRKNVRHSVQIGERQVLAGEGDDGLPPQARGRSLATLIGWVLLALAILFIIYHFYKVGVSPAAAGRSTQVLSMVALP